MHTFLATVQFTNIPVSRIKKKEKKSQNPQFVLASYCLNKDFAFTISLKKTQLMGQEHPPPISLEDYELETVHESVYLG